MTKAATQRRKRISNPKLSFAQIQDTLHASIREDARDKARSLVSKFTGHPVSPAIDDESLIQSLRELDTPQTTAQIREAYELHLVYGGVMNTAGHALAYKCKQLYKSYIPCEDAKFFNMK